MSDRNTQRESHLFERLERLRRMLRRRLLLYGLCAVGSGGACALLTIIALDWLLWFPPVLRVAIGALFLVGFALASLHWLVRPLAAKLSSAALAGELETRFRYLNDRLSSTVQFLQGEGVGSPSMQRQVIVNTEAVVKNLPLVRSLTLRPLAHSAGLFVATAGLVIYICAFAPSWSRIGVSRYLAPFSDLQWPRRVEIFSLTRDQKVAYGESVAVRMQVVRGASPTLRGVVHLRNDRGDLTTLAMQRYGKDVYACKIDHLTESLVCWFEAGDDTTADQPRTITVVRRPAVVGAVGRLHPPSYAPLRPVHEVDLSAQMVRAVRGSRLDLDIRTSKPVKRRSGAAAAELVIDDTSLAPLHFTGDDPTRLHASLDVTEDITFDIRLTDEHGFASAGGTSYRIAVVADQIPTVNILEPQSFAEVTPSATLRVKLQAADDLGIQALSLVGQRPAEGGEFSIPLTDRLVRTPGAGGRVVGSAEYLWNISALSARPGDTIVYRARVTDNFRTPRQDGQTGVSSSRRLLIVSREVFEQRQRREFALLEEHIRKALLDQELLIDEAARLTKLLDSDPDRRPVREAVGAAARAQARLADELQRLARRVERLIARMEANAAGDEQSRRQARQVASSLGEAALGPMAAATRALEQARTGAEADMRAKIDQGTVQQRQAADALRRVIRSLAWWGDFQEVVAKTRNLLDRQQEVRAATVRQEDKTLGKRVEALDKQDQNTVRKNARRQAMLAEETEQLLARMRQIITRRDAKDPATSGALDDAVRAAAAGRIVQDMRDAASALGANRTAAAQIGQRTAETGLADMLTALQESRKRRLEQLAKTLEQAEQTVAHLLKEQRGLLAATQEGLRMLAGGEVFAGLARRQHLLKKNALRLAREWREREDLARVAEAVKQCGEPMETAAVSLTRGDGSAAVDPQRQALALLEEILEELTRMAAAAQHQAARQQLAVARAKLESLRGRQLDINGKTQGILAVRRERGRLGRLEKRKASTLARRQDGLAAETGSLRSELGQAVVYDFVLGRVLGWMGASSEALIERRIDAALTDTQDRIVGELDMLIAAIADIYNLPPPDEFERGSGSGTRQAGQNAGAAIPTVAELLVLKAMQAALNSRTIRAAGQYDADRATEEELRGVRKLAEEQEQIEVLARKVIEKANERGP